MSQTEETVLNDTDPRVAQGFDDIGYYISVDGSKYRKATKAGQAIVNSYGLTPAEAMHIVMKGF